MTEEQIIKLREIINETLDERDAFSGRTHSDHHRFVEEMIERERRKVERRERLRQQVAGWAIITVLTGIGISVYQLFVDFVKRLSH